MDLKTYPNDDRYFEILRKMTPQQRLDKAFELTEYARDLFKEGLRKRYPEKSEKELHVLFLEQMRECHNENW